MLAGRADHAAAALDNGPILLAGGAGRQGGALAGVEHYDPVNGLWTVPPASAKMASARRGPTATFFLGEEGSGHVLVVGGDGGDGEAPLDTTEIYDTEKQAWSAGPALAEGRRRHTATLLRDRTKILIAGGEGKDGLLGSAVLFAPAESGGWAVSEGSLGEARAGHTATLLRDGAVLIAGGGEGDEALATAEIVTAAVAESSPVWSLRTTAMTSGRACHTATLLHDGRVLVVGGRQSAGGCEAGDPLATAAIYDPERDPENAPDSTCDPWCEVPRTLVEARAGHTATLLDNGMVLIAGGFGAGGPLESAELYDPKKPPEESGCACDLGSFQQAGSLASARAGHTATRLPDGAVLLAGGRGASVLASADVYRPATQCRTLSDCPTSLICNAEKQCVPPEVTCGTESGAGAEGGGAGAGGGSGNGECAPQPSLVGACSSGGGGPGGAGGLVVALVGFLSVFVRRRAPCRRGPARIP